MPYNEFLDFVETSLFSISDETFSFYAEVRRFIFHFISVYLNETSKDNSGLIMKIINIIKWYLRPTKEQGLY